MTNETQPVEQYMALALNPVMVGPKERSEITRNLDHIAELAFAAKNVAEIELPSGARLGQLYARQPGAVEQPVMKWDGEWHITYEVFRDMGIAYSVGLLLIYLLVVAQFRSYLVPLVIMAIQGYHCASMAVVELQTAHLRSVLEARKSRIEDRKSKIENRKS